MSESIQDRVLRVIATTRRVPVETVRPDSTFEELGIDSLDRINILFELETEFEIEIADEYAARVSSIQQMIEGITVLVDAKEKGIEPVWPESLRAPVPAPTTKSALSETAETPGESTED